MEGRAAVGLLDTCFFGPKDGEPRGAPGLCSGLRGFQSSERVVGMAGPLPELPASQATSAPRTVPPTSGQRWAQSPDPRRWTDEAFVFPELEPR